MKHQKVIATDGMILTNGEIYGKEIFIGEGISTYDFYQISEEEYQKIIENSSEEFEKAQI